MKNSDDANGNRNLVLVLGQTGFTKDLPATLVKDVCSHSSYEWYSWPWTGLL